MIAVLSDTHGKDDPRLDGRAKEAVEAADVLVHAGDFTTPAVVDAFESACDRLVAVHGNVDEAAVRDRLPLTTTADVDGLRIAVAHGHEHGETALAMLGRQEEADLVVTGHSHRPGVVDAGEVTIVNPGSHADPRGYVPAHAEIEPTDAGFGGRIVERDGDVIEEFVV